MGYLPEQLAWSIPKRQAPRPTHAACFFCAQRPAELFHLPTFGLADADEPVVLACPECYQQVTFTPPRPAARVVFNQAY